MQVTVAQSSRRDYGSDSVEAAQAVPVGSIGDRITVEGSEGLPSAVMPVVDLNRHVNLDEGLGS